MNVIDEPYSEDFLMESEVKNHLFKSFIHQNLEAIAFVDDELRFVSANHAFCRILGLAGNYRLNRFHVSVLPFSKNPRFNEMVQALVNNILPSFEIETNHNSLDGIEKVLQLKMVRNEEDGVFCGGVLMLKDVTQLQQKNQLLQEELKVVKKQNKELQQYITEKMQLENFAYIASHDMKEPLRMIGNFTKLLDRKYRAQLDENGREYLDFVDVGVKNMNGFIDALLIYSRTERAEVVLNPVKFESLFFLLEMDFQEELAAKNCKINRENLPNSILGCKLKLKELFRNLISNALKFSAPDRPLEINISAKDKGYCWEFAFSDNGIGIEEEYFEKIFMMFKKLHPKNIYPGTGIGLALCKKIVQQHGGDMWVESEINKGTTFYFTINKGC